MRKILQKTMQKILQKKYIAFLLAALLACSFTACGEEDREPPDLTGEWVQPGGDDLEYYHVATIRDDTIMIYWYLVAEDRRELYWAGTFEPPETGKEPYSWTSVNNLALARHWVRASREETKTFTYEKGRIRYTLAMGHLNMGIMLEKQDAAD